MPKKASRNLACPCGSGKKYKHCCQAKSAASSISFHRTLLIAIGLVLVTAIAALLAGSGRSTGVSASSGRVWSAEHGHWHYPGMSDDDGHAPALPLGRPGAQPPGPAPPGKVWSPEHGHWHDAP
jgi:hypothetical protein